MTCSKRSISNFSRISLIVGLAFGMQAPLAATSTAIAGNSGWLDRDNPSGKGDYEDTKSLLTQKCRFVAPPNAFIPVGNGYHNEAPLGCWCVNEEVLAATGGEETCKDIKIKYIWN